MDLEGIQSVTAKNAKAVVEMIRGVSEIIVYGDQKKGQYFEYGSAQNTICSIFCENNVLSHFDKFLCSDLDEVHIQILQTLSILIQNVGTSTQLCTPVAPLLSSL